MKPGPAPAPRFNSERFQELLSWRGGMPEILAFLGHRTGLWWNAGAIERYKWDRAPMPPPHLLRYFAEFCGVKESELVTDTPAEPRHMDVWEKFAELYSPEEFDDFVAKYEIFRSLFRMPHRNWYVPPPERTT
ncbi:hypothetical protein ACFVGM_08755 [Kitasatospora purpeofusca]|uniref:hypothetical protein n=1 Tax=Kitasatospora purpeofusca TaxID=67352 RepID=UPI00368856DC